MPRQRMMPHCVPRATAQLAVVLGALLLTVTAQQQLDEHLFQAAPLRVDISTAASSSLDGSGRSTVHPKLGLQQRRLARRQLLQSDDDASSCPDGDDTLELTNKCRKVHGARQLQWNSSLADAAEEAAKQLAENDCGAQQQGGPSDSDIAYNVFMLRSSGQLQNSSCSTAVSFWYSEQQYYNFEADAEANWRNLPNIGHFSLMVWRDSDEMVRVRGRG